MRVLVTGATGYVGGRLVPRLLAAGHDVRVLARQPAALGADWARDVDIRQADLLDAASLEGIADDIDAAYYLVHGMADGNFEDGDARAAANFRGAFSGPVVYLGGLQPQGEARAHLRSRAEVGRILAAGGPTTEFRAGPIIGSGSASFEMVRYLSERLPVMVTPAWVHNKVRPIAIRDVLAYLEAALAKPGLGVIDIGAEPASFADLMQGYARARGLRKRLLLPTPILAPRLAARWVQLVTPVPNKVAIPIIDGIREDLVGDTTRARDLFDVTPTAYPEAVYRALAATRQDAVATRWTGSRAIERGDWSNVLRETRTTVSPDSPDTVFARITALGGQNGWPQDWAWRLRGAVDAWLGGPGLRRGRRARQLRIGDELDWWRVVAYQPGRHLALAAEMKVPGRAWLTFDVYPEGDGSRVVQSALFEPKGVAGTAYWYGLYPVHRIIFADIARYVAGTRRRKGTAQPTRT